MAQQKQVTKESAPSSAIGRTLVDGRPLDILDSIFHEYSISPVFSKVAFPETFLTRTSEKKFHMAFDQAIRMTPIFQTTVEACKDADEDSPAYCFRQVASTDEWPKLRIFKESTDQGAIEKAKAINAADLAAFDADEHVRSKGLRMAVIRGKSTFVVSIAAPHAFTDGLGGFTFFKKFLLYAVLPKFLWRRVDRLSRDKFVPTQNEAAFKNHFHLRADPKLVDTISTSPLLDPTQFHFRKHENDTSLYGLDLHEVGSVTEKQLKKTLGEIRKLGSSLTFVLAAVAMKTLAALVLHCDYKDPGPLLFMMPIDPRNLGKWGDERDTKFQFPATANLTFLLIVRIPFKKLQDESIEIVAEMIKKDTKRMHDDMSYLQTHLDAQKEILQPGYSCGCSSLRVPSNAVLKKLGVDPVFFESGLRLSGPRCWLSALTFGGQSQIIADVMLPHAEVTPEVVRSKITEVVRGHPVETLFNELDH